MFIFLGDESELEIFVRQKSFQTRFLFSAASVQQPAPSASAAPACATPPSPAGSCKLL